MKQVQQDVYLQEFQNRNIERRQYNKPAQQLEHQLDVVDVRKSHQDESIGNPAARLQQLARMFRSSGIMLNSCSSKTTVDNLEDYKKLLSLIENSAANSLVEEVRNQDIIIFLGNTRSGKGTIINQLLGNKLEAFQDQDTYKILIKKCDPNCSGPSIGNKSVSDTSVPTGWKIKGKSNSEMLIDVPGFDDNRGTVQDISNSFYIREILKNAKSVKIALVADVDGVYGDNVRPFTDLIEKIYTIIPEICTFKNSVSMIFSKVNVEILDADKIRDLLKRKIINEPTLQMSDKSLIEHFYTNKKSVCVYKHPSKVGKIKEEVSKNIVTSISTLRKIAREDLKDVRFGISDRSKVELKKASDKLNEGQHFGQIIEAIKLFYEKKLFEISKHTTTESGIEKAKRELQRMKQQVPNGAKVVDVLTAFCLLDSSIANVIKSSNVIPQATFIEYIDSICGEELSKATLLELRAVGDTLRTKLENEEIKLRKDLTILEKNKVIEKNNQALKNSLEAAQRTVQEIKKGYFRRVLEPLGESLDQAVFNAPSSVIGILGKWTGWW